MMKATETPVEMVRCETDIFKHRFLMINDVEAEIREALRGAEGIIKDTCLSLLNSGGKRLRPLMVIYSGLCFSKLTREMIRTAAAAELIHMASLVHDDIIDKSDNRRGKATINKTYGNHAAVLAGDYIFAKAFSVLSSFKLLRGMEFLVEAIGEMCDGEVKQAADTFNASMTVEDYFSRIGKKTGVLISSCCKAGAAAANASDRDIEVMGEYGMNLGYAFQIIDDILDFTGDEEKLGKPKGMDLILGNITLPVILLMEDEKYGHYMRMRLEKGNIKDNEFDNILEVLNKTGYLKKAFSTAEKCVAKAKSSIYSVQDSPFRAVLLNMADSVIEREY